MTNLSSTMKSAAVVSLLALSSTVYAQKKSVIGFGISAADFKSPAQIEQTSVFKEAWKNGYYQDIDNLNFGFSLMYWKALTSHLDVSVRYNGLFASDAFQSKRSNLKEYYNELEGAAHLRAFNDEKVVNPFLTAGVGIGNYWTETGVAGYAPLGIGVQLNLLKESYIFLQANYRVSFDKKLLPNSLFYSLGITQSLRKNEKPLPKPQLPEVLQDNDYDKDGFTNDVDNCPNTAGTVNGCPDGDRDGVADKDDNCPEVAGLPNYKGCPIPDTDRDGINDEEDKCPQVAGVAKYNGCPVPDTDGDGVNDEQDKCPATAGDASNSGCPVIRQEVVQKVNIAAKSILFVTGKDVLDKRSFAQLNNLAALLNNDATLKLKIDGHTDITGNADKNQVLSERRAAAVKTYLIKMGIDEARITTEGFGSNKPVATNSTAAGRAKNRRVEMNVTNY
jgi:OmpA-OmpF porin, OOP family